MDRLPAARTDDLVITRSGDQLLVYDMASHQIHHLDNVAAAVFDACDGHSSIQEIRASTSLDRDVIEEALHRLGEAKLLQAPFPEYLSPTRISRRTVLRQAGITGAAVVSISAPAAIAAQSNICLELRVECTPGGSNTCCAPGVCDTWATTDLTVCCLPDGLETPSTAVCCSGKSSLVEVGSDIRICIPRESNQG